MDTAVPRNRQFNDLPPSLFVLFMIVYLDPLGSTFQFHLMYSFDIGATITASVDKARVTAAVATTSVR